MQHKNIAQNTSVQSIESPPTLEFDLGFSNDESGQRD